MYARIYIYSDLYTATWTVNNHEELINDLLKLDYKKPVRFVYIRWNPLTHSEEEL